MRVAPRSIAWSRNALNLISALQSTSGFGVRPAWYSRRNSANTRSLYSAEKLTASSGMSMTSAAAAASMKSCRVEQYSSVSSSSQFFMKRPTTSYPWRFKSSAATDESTPPDIPTTTLSPIDSSAEICGESSRARRSGEFTAEHLEREARPGEVVGNAALDERRAVHRAARRKLLRSKPVQCEDLAIERAPRLNSSRVATERKAQERRIARRVMPAIDADERRWRESVRRFFEHFAGHRVEQRLSRVQMTCGLVQHAATFGFFLDEKKATAALDDGSDGDCRLPDAHAALRVFLRMNASMRATPCSICSLDAA